MWQSTYSPSVEIGNKYDTISEPTLKCLLSNVEQTMISQTIFNLFPIIYETPASLTRVDK